MVSGHHPEDHTQIVPGQICHTEGEPNDKKEQSEEYNESQLILEINNQTQYLIHKKMLLP